MDSPTVTLKFMGPPEQTRRFYLHEGRLNLSAVNHVFDLIELEVDGVVVDMDPNTKLSHQVFVPGSVLNVTGIPAGSGSRVSRPTQMTEEGLSRASRYTAFIEMTHEDSGHKYRTAAVVCSSRHIATYQHGGHKHLKTGHPVQVHLPATRQIIPTKVVLVESRDKLDCIILAVQGTERLEAPELRPADRGEAYAVLGQSCQKPGGFGTYEHGHIASTRVTKCGHILGDTFSGKGDSGAGVFSLDGGYLLGMCVGRDAHYQKTVIVPAAALVNLLTSLDLSEDELSDMELEPTPTYESE